VNRKAAIRLGFAGDLMLGGEASRHAEENGLDVTYPFKALHSTLGGLDVLFLNLEGPLFTSNGRAMMKPLLLANHPQVIEVLKLPRICVCSLANNHSFDYGADNLIKTQRHLERHGIYHVGAGHSMAQARRPLILEHDGWHIGCLAFADIGPGLRPVVASNGHAGCSSLRTKTAVLEAVRRLRKRVDFLVIMLHWGLEFHEYPSVAQVRFARALVTAGAHVVAGHHPHALQPLEIRNGAVIAYSLGHLYMPPFRSRNNGPVFYPRPASKEFILMRLELPGGFPASPAAMDVVAGGVDAHFRLRPYNRIALQRFATRLDALAAH